jgi:hypothetical protein
MLTRRWLWALAGALAALAPAAPASAQDKLINTPAEKFVTAPGGVDMRTGRFVYEETDLAIGGEGNAGLALKRILTANVAGHGNPFANLSHNWDIMVSELRINIDDPQNAGQDFQINVHFGGRSQTYQSRYNAIGYQQMSPGAWAPLTYHRRPGQRDGGLHLHGAPTGRWRCSGRSAMATARAWPAAPTSRRSPSRTGPGSPSTMPRPARPRGVWRGSRG